jgi:hypothetical protein
MENGRQLVVSLYRHFVAEVVTLDVVGDGQPEAIGPRTTGRIQEVPCDHR